MFSGIRQSNLPKRIRWIAAFIQRSAKSNSANLIWLIDIMIRKKKRVSDFLSIALFGVNPELFSGFRLVYFGTSGR